MELCTPTCNKRRRKGVDNTMVARRALQELDIWNTLHFKKGRSGGVEGSIRRGGGEWGGRRACLHAVRCDNGLRDTGRVMGELSPGPGAELLY